MRSLQTVQKTFRVFQVITKIAMILSFVWMGLTALGMLCGTVWYHGGVVIGADRELLYALTETGGLAEMMDVLLADTIFALTDGVLLALALGYFKAEQAEGTPFTLRGAKRVLRLGICTIVLPMAAIILTAALHVIFGLPQHAGTDLDNLTSLTVGIGLILTSFIFRYGTELEENRARSDAEGNAAPCLE